MTARALLYLSNGNIPSRWAHTLQTVKMCEAFAELVPDVRLVIASSLRDWLSPRVDLWDWYGVRRPFPVTRLPLWLWRRDPVFTSVREKRFSSVAPIWAAHARPALVWTRSYPVADRCLRRGLPVVVERHSPSPPKFEALIGRLGASPWLRGFVTNSAALIPAHVAAGIPHDKAAAFPNGVEAPGRVPGPIAAVEARRALGLARGPIALYVGSLSPEKGLPTLLAAAALLPAVQFEVLGGAPAELVRLRTLAPANTRLRGFVPHSQLATWYAAADVGLFPNSALDPIASSTSPLKVLEYIGAGLPVVATSIPAVASWLRHRETAYVCAPDDPAALAAAIREALADPVGARTCAERALASQQRFTWRERAERMLERFAPELLAAPASR